MNRREYYYRQMVTESELNSGFDQVETADRNLAIDTLPAGIARGMVASERSPQSVAINVTAGVAYDQLGRRIEIPSLQNLSLTVDRFAVSTDVATPGNEKWIGVWVNFKSTQSDARVDGNSNTVYFVQDESFEFLVEQGAEATIGNAVRPSLKADAILVCDVRRVNADTTIANADISTTRREDAIVASGTTYSLTKGTLKETVVQMVTDLGSQVTGSSGTSRVGARARTGSPINLPVGTVDSHTDILQSGLNNHINQVANLHPNSLIFMGRMYNNAGISDAIVSASFVNVTFSATPVSFNLPAVLTDDEIWVDVFFINDSGSGTPVMEMTLLAANFTATYNIKEFEYAPGNVAMRLTAVATGNSAGTPTLTLRGRSNDGVDGISIRGIEIYVQHFRNLA